MLLPFQTPQMQETSEKHRSQPPQADHSLPRTSWRILLLATLTNLLLLSTTSVQSYYVITRLTPAPSRAPHKIVVPMAASPRQHLYAVKGQSPADYFADPDYDYVARSDSSSRQMDKPSAVRGNGLQERKRSAANAKPLPNQEHVCKMIIRNDFQPKFGHEQNGTRVEIQQDDKRQFRATFVECESTKRDQCYGIDNILFTSECVTVYEYRPAGIRLESNPSSDFIEGFVKVPIACQCRLRRKLNRILISEA